LIELKMHIIGQKKLRYTSKINKDDFDYSTILSAPR
jgi:hypothetical protein